MAKRDMVGDVPGNVLGMLGDLNFKLQHGVITPTQLDLFLKKQNPFEVVGWLDAILNREEELHGAFFSKNFAKKFDYSQFSATLEKYGEAKFAEWKKIGLEPHFLPSVEMSQNKDFPGWKVKPEQWFYDQVDKGNVLGSPLCLGEFDIDGMVVLVDTRCKPAYWGNGKQMWENDNLFGEIIAKLREEEKIVDYNPRASRFGVSALEIEQKIAPALATKLGLEPRQVRLERAIEFNVLSQLLTDTLRAKDGETNTRVWFADHFDEYRLNGGHSVSGGFAYVHYYSAGNHWYRKSFRLLAVL